MKGDERFGEPRLNAPAIIPPQMRGPVLFEGKSIPYDEAEKLHLELGQALARGMRKRGSSNPPGGDIGGTPAALLLAA